MSKNCVKRTMPCQCPSCRSESLRMGLSSEQCSFCKSAINVATNTDVWYQFIGDKVTCEPCYKKSYKVCRICARIGVDAKHKGKGLGAALLRHFMFKAIEVAGSVGVRLVLVHAKDEEAKGSTRHIGSQDRPST